MTLDEALDKLEGTSDPIAETDAVQALELELQEWSDSAREAQMIQRLSHELSSCLQSSHAPLAAVSLTCINTYLVKIATEPAVIDAAAVTDCLSSFLESGGLLEKLADAELSNGAQAALMKLAQLACHSSTALPKASDLPLSHFERVLLQRGLRSKLAKTRQCTARFVAAWRKERSGLPLKPYLPSLVEALEDTDPDVRDAAQQSLIDIFADLALPAAARNDLNKEMTRQAIRAATVDAILNAISASIAEAPLDGHKSIFSVDDVPAHQVESEQELVQLVHRMLPYFEGRESEENWQQREESIIQLRGILKGGLSPQYANVLAGQLDVLMQGILKSLATLRTSLAQGTCRLITELAESLRQLMDPHVEQLLAALLRISAQTKKLVVQASVTASSALLTNTSFSASHLVIIEQGYSEKTASARSAAATQLKVFLQLHGTAHKQAIETGSAISLVESCLSRGLADPSPDVREITRATFWISEPTFPSQLEQIRNALDAASMRQLDAVNPRAAKKSAPAPKRMSIREMIAAKSNNNSPVKRPSMPHQPIMPAHKNSVTDTSPTASPRANGAPRQLSRTLAKSSTKAAQTQAAATDGAEPEKKLTDRFADVSVSNGDTHEAPSVIANLSRAGKKNWWAVHADAQASKAFAASPSDSLDEAAAVLDSMLSSLKEQRASSDNIRHAVSASRSFGDHSSETLWTSETRLETLLGAMFSAAPSFDETMQDSLMLLLRELVLHQYSLFGQQVAPLIDFCLSQRSRSGIKSVEAAAEAVLDEWAELTEPFAGLECLRTSLSRNPDDSTEAAAQALAMGVEAMGKILARLPSQNIEEELRLSRELILRALNDARHPQLRQAAVACLVSAQRSLQNANRLFELLADLAPSQVHLITYYIAKDEENR
ncbi:uncharacterized protein L969DRAFT_90560 [Mixia osmundae IAM 14324]|uniref:TOG domain-containing protein n=1 Tax=Mixia osmundae (strain CBS 9802 / IAM 14324 / JCM 22182 / KY 12970) TaxID=764103 RepID=G7E1D8_MIXOS|nr:uncharacterized protein L969DRAFT_90560 [Mixia osmundae IAM 14324]KEI36600.1 hypothetical protein L969DRAFT_90560 [Mixia osmundae IAM 14324]GAA96648.1 hypothetical protein E5Q_03319 [Mixia osmundae IAM 14324]